MNLTARIGTAISNLGSRLSGNQFYLPYAGEFITALRRQYDMYFDAASKNRLTSDWKTVTDTPYNDIRSDLQAMIARSRSSADNNGLSTDLDETFVVNVIGERGLKPVPMVMENAEDENEAANRILAEGWKRYNDQWDRTGKSSYYENQRLMLRTLINSGSILVNRVPSRQGDFLPVANQIIEPDRLDWSRDTFYATATLKTSPNTQFGIEHDEYGVPQRFWVNGIKNPISADAMDIRFRRRRPE